LQIVSVDEQGAGIKRIRPKSLYDMLKVCCVSLCCTALRCAVL
jgi:hypothetical protein